MSPERNSLAGWSLRSRWGSAWRCVSVSATGAHAVRRGLRSTGTGRGAGQCRQASSEKQNWRRASCSAERAQLNWLTHKCAVITAAPTAAAGAYPGSRAPRTRKSPLRRRRGGCVRRIPHRPCSPIYPLQLYPPPRRPLFQTCIKYLH